MIKNTDMQPFKQVNPSLEEICGEFRVNFFPATYYLKERQRYIFEFEQADRLFINGRPTLPLLPDSHLFEVCIENNLGLTSIQPACGAVRGEKIWFEVYAAHKFTPAEHLTFYQGLVADLFQQAANLPFCFESVTQRGVAESTRPPTPLFTYYFLKANLVTFAAAIETVLAEPHRLLCDHPDLVPLAEASEVDSDVILSILQSPETWVACGDFALSRMLQVDGRKYAPQRVWQRLPEETYNTPENRFILHFLRQVLAAAEVLPRQSWWSLVAGSPKAQAILDLTALLRQTVTHPMFDEVGELYHLPLNSQVLMRREGYRDLLILWQQFHSACSPLFDAWQQAIDMRAMHHLYEIWVFFKLVNLIGACKTVNVPISDIQGLEYKAKAVFQDGAELYYNKTFHPSFTHSFYSYSMVLRPDYYWVDRLRNRSVVLDAKFSMSVEEKELESEVEGEPPAIWREGHPIREDLYKMHTYRDALIGTQAAVIIYPGTVNLFLPILGKRIYDASLNEVLRGYYDRVSEQDPFSAVLNGIGAITLIPELKDDSE